MVTLLGWIVDGVAGIGTLALWAIEEAIDAFFAAMVAAWNAALSLLPSMGDAPSIGTPTWLGWLNWFYPLGAALTMVTGILAAWISFLAVRYILRLVRAV